MAVAGEASPWSLAFGLMRALDMGQAEPPPSGRRPAADRRDDGRGRHADRGRGAEPGSPRNPRGGASFGSLEWLRAMAEDGCISLVLSGDLRLADAMAQLPQLRSRMRRPVVVRARCGPGAEGGCGASGVASGGLRCGGG